MGRYPLHNEVSRSGCGAGIPPRHRRSAAAPRRNWTNDSPTDLLDVMRPVTNGSNLLAPQADTPPDVPVIFMSALHETVDSCGGSRSRRRLLTSARIDKCWCASENTARYPSAARSSACTRRPVSWPPPRRQRIAPRAHDSEPEPVAINRSPRRSPHHGQKSGSRRGLCRAVVTRRAARRPKCAPC